MTNSLHKNLTELCSLIFFTVYRSNVLIEQLFEHQNIPSTYFSRMSFLKIKGQNFEAASWPQLISSNFKDHTKRLAKVRSSHSEMGHIQNCPQPKKLDPWLKGFPDKRLFLLRCTSFLSFLKGEDTVIINQCPNYPVIMN